MERCLRLRLAGGKPGGIGDIVAAILDKIEFEAKSLDEAVFGRGGSAAGGNVGGGTTIIPFIAEVDVLGGPEAPVIGVEVESPGEAFPRRATGASSVVGTLKLPGTGCAYV